jgi:hypothetical protein
VCLHFNYAVDVLAKQHDVAVAIQTSFINPFNVFINELFKERNLKI